MKTQEELNAIKAELENLNQKLSELSEDELDSVVGGFRLPPLSSANSSGYQISQRLRPQIGALDAPCYNPQPGNITGGGVPDTAEILRTFRENTVSTANDTNTDIDRAVIHKEIEQSIAQIDDNALTTFNGKIL